MLNLNLKNCIMAHVINCIHCVWATRRRFPYLTGKTKDNVIGHIREIAGESGIYIDFINAYKDHVHCLISLGPDQKLCEAIKLIKGESSRWIRETIPSCENFNWAREYYAVSVGPGVINRVRNYIRDQEKHHAQKNWQQEQEEIRKAISNCPQQYSLDKHIKLQTTP